MPYLSMPCRQPPLKWPCGRIKVGRLQGRSPTGKTTHRGGHPQGRPPAGEAARRGGHLQRRLPIEEAACGCLLPPWTPYTVHLWKKHQIIKTEYWLPEHQVHGYSSQMSNNNCMLKLLRAWDLVSTLFTDKNHK
jgi:hypothetical protein